jgi:hypothetical protein
LVVEVDWIWNGNRNIHVNADASISNAFALFGGLNNLYKGAQSIVDSCKDFLDLLLTRKGL